MAEANECYIVGPITETPQRPGIAIEVVWTSGGIDKLEVYRGLGVAEVWIWQAGSLRFFLLQGDSYLPGTRSRLLADLGPDLIARCMAQGSQTQAVRTLHTALDFPAEQVKASVDSVISRAARRSLSTVGMIVPFDRDDRRSGLSSRA